MESIPLVRCASGNILDEALLVHVLPQKWLDKWFGKHPPVSDSLPDAFYQMKISKTTSRGKSLTKERLKQSCNILQIYVHPFQMLLQFYRCFFAAYLKALFALLVFLLCYMLKSLQLWPYELVYECAEKLLFVLFFANNQL